MLRRIQTALAVLCVLTASANAQETRGTIVGKITDPSGAFVPGATVVVTNSAMGTKTTFKTGENGFYQATFLIPGVYQVEATAQGFKKAVRDGVQVQVNDRLEINLALEVGAAEQSVTITAEAPLLNTESATVGTVVDAKRIADLPLTYGNPFALISLSGGVAFTGDPRLDRPFEPTHIIGYAMAGTRGNLSDVTIDGAPSTATANGNQVIASYVPPTDIVQEFKVQTATFDAQFGQTQGGVTNIVMKSGTNAFHGTGYFSFYRPSLWANDFFNNTLGRDRPDFWFNRWGGSFGGPIYIPKVYNGRNKTFIMWGYEGLRDSRPRFDSGVTTVPTPDMKKGDFSSLLKVGSSYTIYDPATRTGPVGGRYTETAFPGNIVPVARFSTVAKAVLPYFPDPTSPGNADGTANLLRPDLAEKLKYRNHSWRVDQNIGSRQRIYVRASLYDRYSTYNNYFDNAATGVTFKFVSRAAVFDHVFTITPTMVLNTRYSYNRYIRFQDQNLDAVGFDLTKLGFSSAYAAAIPKDIGRFPQFNMTGYIPTASTQGENRPVMNHTLSATLSKALNAHSIRSGFEFRAYQETDRFFGLGQTGSFSFDSTYTRGPLDNASAAPGSLGQSVAAFLLGIPTSGSVNRTADYAEQSNSWGFFVQDDWKATSRLTINIGLRWEFEQPLHERWNKSVLGFDFGYVQPFSAAAQTAYAKNPTPEIPVSAFGARGGLTFAGINGNPSGLYNTPRNGFLPRLGMAYRLGDHSVVRAGAGMFQGFLGERRGDVIQSGFSQVTNMVVTTDNGLHFADFTNPFPAGIQEPVGAKNAQQTFLGSAISFFNQNPRVPRVFRWEFGLQREVKGGFLVQANYVGNKTYHIEISRNLNALPTQYLSTSPSRDNVTNSYLTATIPNPFVGLQPGNTTGIFTSANVSRQSLLIAYPEFGNVTNTSYEGASWYHSIQLGVERRFSKGFTVALNYTFAKFMQATELLNAGDVQPVRVISDQDVPHRISLSGIWEVPFGKGHTLLNSNNPIVSRLVSGWRFSGIWNMQSGFPTGFGNLIYYGDPKNIVRPISDRSVAKWFNTDGFEKATANQLVSNVRTFPLRFPQIRNPRQNNADLALIKDTRVAEGKNIQFRAEALNAMNHPYLPAPNTTPTAATFGTISAATQAAYPRRIQLSIKYIF